MGVKATGSHYMVESFCRVPLFGEQTIAGSHYLLESYCRVSLYGGQTIDEGTSPCLMTKQSTLVSTRVSGFSAMISFGEWLLEVGESDRVWLV